MPGTSSFASTIVLLRLPFFVFLTPIYLFALAASPGPLVPWRCVAVFFVYHFLLYPASNGFNSWYDRDTGPIGGLASPPQPTRSLMWTSLGLDAAALVVGFALDPWLGLGALLYGTGSKLYSWERTRLKARPVAGWLATGLGQGALTFLAMVAALSPLGLGALGSRAFTGAALQTVFLLGIFPLTQVYQHEEDGRRGDLTISRLVGVRGTFVLASTFLFTAAAGIAAWLLAYRGPAWAAAFLLSQTPSLAVFASWARRVSRDPAAADFRSAMAMSITASALMNLFFIALLALGQGGR